MFDDDDYEDRMHDIRTDEEAEARGMGTEDQTAVWMRSYRDGSWTVYVLEPDGRYRAVSRSGREATGMARDELAVPLAPAASLPDPTTPEAAEFAAEVCRHWTRECSGDPHDSKLMTGRAAEWLARQAELLRQHEAGAAAVDTEVEELARWLYEREKRDQVTWREWDELSQMEFIRQLHVGQARDLIAAGWSRR